MSDTTVLCTNLRFGLPRQLRLNEEEDFSGAVCRGLSDDYQASCASKHVVVLGMETFALENMQTSFERGAAHVTMLCRPRGTVCPQMVDWIDYVRPFNAEGRHEPVGDMIVLSYWQRAYDTSGALRPDCWQEGMLKPDGHTVSASDTFFIGHFSQKLMTVLGEVDHLKASSVVTGSHEELQADVIIKCIGFELNEGNEKLLGRLRMGCTGQIGSNLWLQVEPHPEPTFPSSPFGSSYLNVVRFNATFILHQLRDSGFADRLAHLKQPPVRINTVTVSKVHEGTYSLSAAGPEVPLLLQQHLSSIAEEFNATMTPKQYITQNQLLWEETQDLLVEETGNRFEFPFTRLFVDLPDIDCNDDEVDVTCQNATPQGATAVLPMQVLAVAREAIG
eukprot:5851771-Prymnesium_polylepis.1